MKQATAAIDFIQSIHHHREIDNTDELRGRFFHIFLSQATRLPEGDLWDVIEEGLRDFHLSEVTNNTDLSTDMPFPATSQIMEHMVFNIRRAFKQRPDWNAYLYKFDEAAQDFLQQYS